MNWKRWVAIGGVGTSSLMPSSAFEILGPAPSMTADAVRGPRLAGPETGPEAAEALGPVNTSSRETSRLFYRTVYAASMVPPPLWSGNVLACDPGATDPAYRELVARRINYFRAMSGVPAGIVLLDDYSTRAQAAALIVSRNLQVNHNPPPEWGCYTATGAEASGRSILAVGRVGPQAIDAYIEDFGAVNANVGHRRWLLYPQTRAMGSGDIPAGTSFPSANATWVLDDNFGAARPITREEFVAWPPPGHVPAPLVFPRWSFSLPHADFAATTVTVTSNGVPVAVELGPVTVGAGENTLVWHATGQQTSNPTLPARPATDTVYEVTLANVIHNGMPRQFSYNVVVFDPDQPGPDTVLPAISGPLEPTAGVPNGYTFTAVPVASGHQWLRARRVPFTGVEGAETGLGTLVASTSPGYSPVTSEVKAAGAYAFHLAHPMPLTDQTLTLEARLIPAANGELRFKEYLGAATPVQTGRVEVSLDDGLSWTTVFSKAGSSGGGLPIFQSTAVPLGAFAGRIIRVRFNYSHAGGDFYRDTDPQVGWHLDEIGLVNTETLEASVVSPVPTGNRFIFVPPALGPQLLAVRGEFLGRYGLEWSLPLDVEAAPPVAQPVITLLTRPVITGNQVQLGFQVFDGNGAMAYELQSAPSPAGPWAAHPDAGSITAEAGGLFRVVAPVPGLGQRFFRVRGQ